MDKKEKEIIEKITKAENAKEINEFINFISFASFQLDILKANITIKMNNIDKLDLVEKFDKDSNQKILKAIDNLGKEIITELNKLQIKKDKK